MADNYNIYQQCPRCGGDGKVLDASPPSNTVERDCTHCEGVGEIYWGQMREEEAE